MPSRLVISAPRPTANRFQPLIATMAKVRAAISSGEKTASRARKSGSGAPAREISVSDSHHASAARSRSLKNGVSRQADYQPLQPRLPACRAAVGGAPCRSRSNRGRVPSDVEHGSTSQYDGPAAGESGDHTLRLPPPASSKGTLSPSYCVVA